MTLTLERTVEQVSDDLVSVLLSIKSEGLFDGDHRAMQQIDVAIRTRNCLPFVKHLEKLAVVRWQGTCLFMTPEQRRARCARRTLERLYECSRNLPQDDI